MSDAKKNSARNLKIKQMKVLFFETDESFMHREVHRNEKQTHSSDSM